jgi:hypothetical protein
MARPSPLSLLPLALLVAAPAPLFAAPVVQTIDVARVQPQVAQIVAAISPERIEARVRKLASFQTRHTLSDTASETVGIGAARRWIKAELERCGGRLQVAAESHVEPVSARVARPVELVNIVATLPGTQEASRGRTYVVSGHYDSINGDKMDTAGAAPGADDDASGVAAVMELACAMANQPLDATIVFLAVAGEEQGLLGSTHWAEQARLQQRDIAGMFTNDIIGNTRADDGRLDDSQVRLFAEGMPQEFTERARALAATGGENDSPSRQLARHVKEAGERYIPGFKVNIIQRRDRYLRSGDHKPFLERGYAALRFTEPNEDYAHQHQNVREEGAMRYGDTPEFVDFQYIARVARVNAAALATLALAPAAPRQVHLRTAKLENSTDLVWQPNTEPDLAGYRIVWRSTDAPQWQGGQFVGKVSEAVVRMSKDNVIFGVQAVDGEGNASVASYPTPQP